MASAFQMASSLAESAASKADSLIGNPLRKVTGMIGRPPAPLWGGITSLGAKTMHELMQTIPLSRKNLFHVSIRSLKQPKAKTAGSNAKDGNPSFFDKAKTSAMSVMGDTRRGEYLINLLALDVAFTPNTITGDDTPIGSSVIDNVTGTGRTEMQITTMDDATGSIKRWFEGKCAQIANSDGTFGVPADYLVEITVKSMDVLNLLPSAFTKEYKYTMRPVSAQLNYARGEQAMETIQLSFTQFDTHLSL
jgi:hypothetical protein